MQHPLWNWLFTPWLQWQCLALNSLTVHSVSYGSHYQQHRVIWESGQRGTRPATAKLMSWQRRAPKPRYLWSENESSYAVRLLMLLYRWDWRSLVSAWQISLSMLPQDSINPMYITRESGSFSTSMALFSKGVLKKCKVPLDLTFDNFNLFPDKSHISIA